MERTILEVHGSLHVAIPKDLARTRGWKAGDRVSFREVDGSLVMEGVPVAQRGAAYSVGYEGRSSEELLHTLRDHSITKVVDVREHPISRRPGFSKRPLSAALQGIGTEYFPFPELGSPSTLRHTYREGGDFAAFEQGYRKYLESRSRELRELRALVAEGPTALLCYERDWRACHRSVLSRFLEKEGFTLVHL